MNLRSSRGCRSGVNISVQEQLHLPYIIKQLLSNLGFPLAICFDRSRMGQPKKEWAESFLSGGLFVCKIYQVAPYFKALVLKPSLQPVFDN